MINLFKFKFRYCKYCMNPIIQTCSECKDTNSLPSNFVNNNMDEPYVDSIRDNEFDKPKTIRERIELEETNNGK